MAKRSNRKSRIVSKASRKVRKSPQAESKVVFQNLIESEIERLRQLGLLVHILQLQENKWLVKTRLKEDKANNVYGFGLSRTLYDALCKSYISSTRKTKLAGFERASENARLLAEEDFRLFGRGRSRLDSKAWDRIKELGL